jgi:hypothetical protein
VVGLHSKLAEGTSMRGSQILVVLFLFQRSRLLVREGENFIPAQNRSRAGDPMCCLTFSSGRVTDNRNKQNTRLVAPMPSPLLAHR